MQHVASLLTTSYLASGIGVVVTIAQLIAQPKDRHVLAAEVEIPKLPVVHLVPRSAAPLDIGACVPRRSSDDEGVVFVKLSLELTDNPVHAYGLGGGLVSKLLKLGNLMRVGRGEG